ncbi:hypothetical protein TIFTF001_055776 [Ficus carica]|uniref:RNase H type-1 domain-containing protein n=1 Tax=Ficus carica TaxID=3494 RepID=A0AA88EIU8_FICCA|nr:hypothetical protein TIFTF001_055776 [Ficus carica]
MGLRKRRFNPLPTVGNVLPGGDIKIHVDAAVKQHLNYVGIGVVMRDDEGVVLHAFSKRILGVFSPHVAECLAAREGSSLATSLGYNR